MPVDWMDVSRVSFKTLLLLERAQLSWFPGWLPERELAVALKANPAVEWFMRHKCPEINPWLDTVLAQTVRARGPQVRAAEIAVLRAIEDLVVYALDPAAYDAQPFLGWDSAELTSLVDFAGKTVIDVGAGTGRLALVAAEHGALVFAVEPVANLRHYLKQKATARGLRRVYPVDGLITAIPFPDGFADIVMGGHVFGDQPEAECDELHRVAKPGGMIILCPGASEPEQAAHEVLVTAGFAWSRFEEPRDGWKRKYWKIK
jgi:SAM-dependent methyltransferase